MRRSLLAAAIVAAAAACAAAPTAGGPEPAWAAQGTGAFTDPDGDHYHGVGAGKDLARAELMKAVHRHLCAIGRGYLASLTAGAPEPTEPDRCPPLFPSYRPEAASGASVLAKELREATVLDGVWEDSADGSTKAHARIGRTKVDEILIRNLNDDPKLQAFIRARSSQAWDEELAEQAGSRKP